MLTVKNISGAATYGAYLSNNDYYSVGETVKGQWMGRGADLLGLDGEVILKDFEAIRQCKDPKTGEYLRERESADRYKLIEKDGEQLRIKVASAVELYDFTLSAPKDISIMATIDPRLHQAHEAGMQAAFGVIEGLAGAGIHAKGDPERHRRTSNLIIARYDHDTSRALDPQDHSHLVAANLTYDGIAAKWKALDATEIYKQQELVTEAYRNAAAAKTHSLGYPTVNLFLDGKDNGFGIVGITPEIREKFSQRTQEKNEAVASFIEANGRVPSKDEVARLMHETRDPKLKEITSAEVQAQIRVRTAEYSQTLNQIYQTALAAGDVREYAPAAPSLAYATDHIFERNSVAKDFEIQAQALVHGRGRIDLAELKGELQAQIAMGHMLTARTRVGSNVATDASLERERRMVATVDEGVGKYEPLGRELPFVPSEHLRAEQRASVLDVLASRDFVFNVQGAAGTGKTNLLEDVHRGFTEARRSVLAVAPSVGAVDELRKVGLPEAITISRLLVDPQKQQELAGQVLLIDEAGMVGSQEMDQLLKLAQSKGARMLTVGDSRQIKSVLQGDALRVLESESKLKSTSLVEVQRQSNAEYKAAVQALRDHPAKGYELLEKMGAIREVDWRLVGKETSKTYREVMAVPNRQGQARSVLVVAGTHDQIRAVTHAIRADRKAAGEIVDGQKLAKYSAVNWTEAQRKQMDKYQPGQVLVFHKVVKGVAKNEALEVVSADKRAVTARKSNGETLSITSRQVKAFGVFEKEQIEVSAGDKLLLQANWRDKSFRATNGQLVTVASVEQGAIKLEDGRQLPAGYRQFTHGYAVTAHVAQGKSVDWVIPVVDKMRADLGYVALTRGKEGVTAITSDKTAFEAMLGVSGDRQSAIELARQAAMGRPAQPPPDEDLLSIYKAQQQAQSLSKKTPQQEQIQTQEIATNVNKHNHEISHAVSMGI